MLCTTIIPTIGRPTLARAVRSALSQGLDPDQHEIIVVNDSGQPLSQDDWLALPQVKIIQVNRCGLNVVCNVGAAAAQGKYLNFLHDDDYLLPGGLEALVKTAEASNASWVVGGITVVDDKGDVVFRVESPGLAGNLFAFYVVGEVVHICQSLITREAFRRVGGFDPLVKISEDRDLGCRIAFSGDFASCDQVVACVRIAGSAGSTYDFSNIVHYSRLVREKALTTDGATRRLLAAVQKDIVLRGRVCRGFLFSAVLNLKSGRPWTALSRLYGCCRVGLYYPATLSFWKGMTYQQHSVRPRNLKR